MAEARKRRRRNDMNLRNLSPGRNDPICMRR